MQTPTTARQYGSSKARMVVVGLLVLACLWYVIAKVTAPPANTLVGQQRHVINPGFETVTLFRSNEELSNGIVAQSVGDDAHALDIARRGRVVPTGAQVVIEAIDDAYSHPSAKVRLLDGSNTSGWVTMDKLSP